MVGVLLFYNRLHFEKAFAVIFYFFAFSCSDLVQPVGHLTPQMKVAIINRCRNTVIFFRITGALKIYNISSDRIDHFDPILKMDIIISRAMDDEEFSFYPIRKIKW